MARWEGLGMGRFLAVTEQGNLEEGQPRLLATLDPSQLQVLASHEGGGRVEVLAVTAQGDLDDGQLTLLAASDTSNCRCWWGTSLSQSSVRFS